MMKRLLAALLALACTVSLCSGGMTVSAAARPTETVTVTYINPLYEGSVCAAELNALQTADTDEQIEYCTTLEEAAQALREQMKVRQENITLYYKTTGDFSQLLTEIYNLAVAHTGQPTEGDYLLWHCAGWNGGMTYTTIGTVTYISLSYAMTYYTDAQQEEAADTAAEQLLDSLALDGMTDYQKVKAIYDWMTANITYDYDNLYDSSYKLKFSAYAALVNGTAVCQGYAQLLYRLLLTVGVDCRVIVGYANGDHAWNIVGLDGLYYNADATWDAGAEDYSCFLVANSNLDYHYRNDTYDCQEFNGLYPMSLVDYSPEASCVHNTVVDEAVAPTCTESGLTEGSHCSICGMVFVRQETVDATGHDWVQSADSTEALTVYVCQNCGDSYSAAVGVEEWPFSEEEWQVLLLTNRERLAEGLEPLTGFSAIQDAAGVRVNEIVLHYSHTRPSGASCFTALDEASIGYTSAGENIASGYSTPEAVVTAWMNSEGHRANILNAACYHMGVGYRPSYLDSWGYWVQLFVGSYNEQYTSFELVVPEGLALHGDICIDDLGIYALLENSAYGTCYLPIMEEFCTVTENADGSVTLMVSVLGFTVEVELGKIHEMGDWYTVTEPTCIQLGQERRDCKECDYYELREMELVGHSWVDADCENAKTCSVCGMTEGEALGHIWVDADCENAKTCSVCGATDGKALGHSYSSQVVVKPDGETAGVLTYTCTRCGYSYSVELEEKDWLFSEEEWRVLLLTNRERLAEGLAPLTGFAAIQDATGIRADEITTLFSHTRPDGSRCFTVLDDASIAYSSAGENIAAGYFTPEAAVTGWMNSEGHRANILTASFTHMGVGYSHASSDYEDYWVQLFVGSHNEQYTSFELVVPEGTALHTGISIDDLGIYALLENSVYGICYLPIMEEFCTVTEKADGSVVLTVSVLGYTAEAELGQGHTPVYECALNEEPSKHSTGSVTVTCTVCGFSYDQLLPALSEEDYYVEVDWKMCNALNDVYYTWKNTVFGTFTFRTAQEMKHDFAAEVETAPTADTTGTLRLTCTHCGITFTERMPVITEADYTIEEWSVPDCTESGWTLYTWLDTYYGQISFYAEQPALGHTPGDAVTENGDGEGCYDEVVYCTVCGGEVSRVHHTPGILGDVNGDGYVDSDDAALILKYDVGLIDEMNETLGDVNGDGYVDSDDAALILKYDVGLIENFT